MRDWGAKHLIAAALMLVVGLIAGGVGPRAEVRELRDQVKALEERPCAKGSGRQIANVFGGRPWGSTPSESSKENPRDQEPDAEEPKDRDVEVKIGNGKDLDEPSDEDIGLVKDALALRRTQAMAALREQAGASEEQMKTVEAAVDTMNTNLRSLAEEFVETVKAGEDPSRRDMMLFAADTLDVLIETEDALYGALPAEQREDLEDSVLDPTSYVDSSVIDVLAALDR